MGAVSKTRPTLDSKQFQDKGRSTILGHAYLKQNNMSVQPLSFHMPALPL